MPATPTIPATPAIRRPAPRRRRRAIPSEAQPPPLSPPVSVLVTDLEPQMGPAAGGSTVTLRGAGFAASSIGVRLGGRGLWVSRPRPTPSSGARPRPAPGSATPPSSSARPAPSCRAPTTTGVGDGGPRGAARSATWRPPGRPTSTPPPTARACSGPPIEARAGPRLGRAHEPCGSTASRSIRPTRRTSTRRPATACS